MATDGRVVALASRRKRQPAEPEPATATDTEQQQADLMTLRLVLVFTVDGQAVAHAPFVAQVPKPADDQAAQLQLTLDGRVLTQWLEPHVGPSQATAAKPKLWTPGA